MIDCVGKLNYLGRSVMHELYNAVRAVEDDETIKAAIVLSAKPDNFVIGADLYEIRQATTVDELSKLSSLGQTAMNIMAASKKPFVIAINGLCFGGGLELALAGHWRIATADTNTQLALPETRLGIIPGLGGTQRLPRLVGLKSALSMIISADAISSAEALSIGLIDELVESDELMERAERRALALSADPSPIANRVESWSDEQGRESGVKATQFCLRDLDEEKAKKLFAMTERSVRIKTRGNYPAQTRALEVMKTGLSEGMGAGLVAESKAFGELAAGEVSANLIALFFSTEFARQSAIALAAKFGETNTQRIGIVGGGTMGTSIANLAAARGLHVKLRVNPGKEADTLERVRALVPRIKGTEPDATADDILSRIECTSDWNDLADSEFVLEAVAEELGPKHQVLQQIEAVVSPDCTIASNTSSLPLDEVGSVIKKIDRFVGVHFFHPVDKMPLVEVVALKTTSRKSLGRAADVVTRFGKIPAMVKNGPGFLINRLLTCYIQEAARAVEEGVPLSWFDEAAVHFGMPIGPWELIDEVGVDVSFTVADLLYEKLGNRMKPPQLTHDFRKLDAIGRKAGRGVYLWDESGRRKEINPDTTKISYIRLTDERCPDPVRERLAQRIVFPMIDEAARCLEDRVVTKPREIDMAVVHGFGFPPFRGGLLKYADRVGLKEVVGRLKEIYAESGLNTVSPLLERYVAEGRNFYSLAGKEDE